MLRDRGARRVRRAALKLIRMLAWRGMAGSAGAHADGGPAGWRRRGGRAGGRSGGLRGPPVGGHRRGSGRRLALAPGPPMTAFLGHVLLRSGADDAAEYGGELEFSAIRTMAGSVRWTGHRRSGLAENRRQSSTD